MDRCKKEIIVVGAFQFKLAAPLRPGIIHRGKVQTPRARVDCHVAESYRVVIFRPNKGKN